MTIQDLGSVWGLVAALATVVTLVYLAVQIRANTTAIRAEGRRAILGAGTAIRVAIAQDGELALIFNVGLGDFSKLNSEEKTPFVFALSDFVGGASQVYEEVTLGIQSEGEFEGQRNIIEPFLNMPGGRELWRLFGQRFPAPFQEWGNKEIIHRKTA